MKRAAVAVALIMLATPLGACQTLLAVMPAANIQTKASQGLYIAEAAFSGASVAFEGALDSGKLKGAGAAKARVLYREAYTILKEARAAKAAGDYVLEMSKASTVTAKAGDLQAVSTTAGGFGVGPN